MLVFEQRPGFGFFSASHKHTTIDTHGTFGRISYQIQIILRKSRTKRFARRHFDVKSSNSTEIGHKFERIYRILYGQGSLKSRQFIQIGIVNITV